MFQIDYFRKMQEYSISQLRQNPEYLELCKCISGQIDNLQKTSEYLLNMSLIDKAEGIYLDYIGWLVGTSRTYFDISKFFSVNSPDINIPKYFYFSSQTISGQSTLNDELFRRRIYAKIGYNTTKGLRSEIVRIIKNMTFADKVIMVNVKPMVKDITLVGKNIIQTNTLRNDVENIFMPGVGIRNFSIVENIEVLNGQTRKTKRRAA